MEQKQQRSVILEQITAMPANIIALHGRDNVAEFVLHSLCHPKCFNLGKAAYFVDNPDFDHFKGIVGYDMYHKLATDDQSCWHDPEKFTQHMQQSIFNQHVRSLSNKSHKKNNNSQKDIIQELAHELCLKNPQYCHWDLKNDNHGLLIFEEASAGACVWDSDDLKNSLHLLSFCPIF